MLDQEHAARGNEFASVPSAVATALDLPMQDVAFMLTRVDQHGLDCFRKAGRIASDCREWAKDNIKPGVSIRSVLESVETMIRERGAAPGFPAQSSRNFVAAHYCSSPEDEQCYAEGDCVKVDIGVHVDGYIADTAATVDLSSDGKWKALIAAARDALNAAIATIEDGVPVGEIGGAIERTILAAGYQPVRNLTGHGLGRWKVHTPPQIPNYAERGGGRLQEGMIFAIEPFATNGRGVIREAGKAEVFMMVAAAGQGQGSRSRRAQGDRELARVADRAALLQRPRSRRGRRHVDQARAPGLARALSAARRRRERDGRAIRALDLSRA